MGGQLVKEARALSARAEVHRSKSRPDTPAAGTAAAAPHVLQEEFDKWIADHQDISRRFAECRSPASSAANSVAATPLGRVSLSAGGYNGVRPPSLASGYATTAVQPVASPK